jgi:hypothetical protein
LGLWSLRSQFLVTHDGRGQRGKVGNAFVTFVNLMVVNDYGSSDEISSVDLLHLTTLLSWNLNRIVPPRIALIRPVRSGPCSGFLVNLSKEEISMRRYSYRGILGSR